MADLAGLDAKLLDAITAAIEKTVRPVRRLVHIVVDPHSVHAPFQAMQEMHWHATSSLRIASHCKVLLVEHL
jgi:hypothetical protein